MCVSREDQNKMYLHIYIKYFNIVSSWKFLQNDIGVDYASS